jgi:hypothetical protein
MYGEQGFCTVLSYGTRKYTAVETWGSWCPAYLYIQYSIDINVPIIDEQGVMFVKLPAFKVQCQ